VERHDPRRWRRIVTQVDDGPDEQVGTDDGRADISRLLFRYLGGEEWHEYRAILGVFSGTFFAEFAPTDVAARLAETEVHLDVGVVGERLESLRRWGNLSASTTVGNPASLDDYYRRRHRYLLTRAGQEVHDLVEGVLQRVDDIGDIQAGRLRDLHRALVNLDELIRRPTHDVAAGEVGDAVRAVFDPHESFSTEITQFFASINQWQSRFDLEPDEIRFFADVLVGYVSEQLVEIERMARPVAQQLRSLEPHLDAVVARAQSGLAARVDDAGLASSVSVRTVSGSRRADWDHLMSWFGAGDGRAGERSRLDSLTRQALAAVQTLTSNLTRQSRVGGGEVSRRGDFIRLAQFVDGAATVDDAHDLVAAAFGLFPSRHLGTIAADADDPVATSTPWLAAPRAEVPVRLRERGNLADRGRTSPIRDRTKERELLRRRIENERLAEQRTAQELLAATDGAGRVDGSEVSARALRRLRLLISAAGGRRVAGTSLREAQDRELHCRVVAGAGVATSVRCPEGTLILLDTDVMLSAAHGGVGHV
jgi:uncharacterized protein (TIGR02677 family)